MEQRAAVLLNYSPSALTEAYAARVVPSEIAHTREYVCLLTAFTRAGHMVLQIDLFLHRIDVQSHVDVL